MECRPIHQYLNQETKEMLNWYCEGFNEYLIVGNGEFPLELSLLGTKPRPLTPLDIISVTHFIGSIIMKDIKYKQTKY